MQELAAHGLTGPAFKQHVIRHHDPATAMLFEQGLDMLEEIQLFVGGGGPEVFPFDNIRLLGGLAVFADNGGAALLAERGIGQDNIETVARIGSQGIAHCQWQFAVACADAVQHKVHGTKAGRALDQLPAGKGDVLEGVLLLLGHIRIARYDMVMGGQQKATGAAGRIADFLARFRSDDIDHGPDQRASGKILTGPGLGILGILFQQALVGIALDIGTHHRPVFLANQIDQQPPQFGRVLKLILGFIEDQAEQALFLTQLIQEMAVMIKQLIAILLDQAGPVVPSRYRARLVIRGLGPLIRHFEKQEIRQLLDVISITHAVVTQDVAVVP